MRKRGKFVLYKRLAGAQKGTIGVRVVAPNGEKIFDSGEGITNEDNAVETIRNFEDDISNDRYDIVDKRTKAKVNSTKKKRTRKRANHKCGPQGRVTAQSRD